MKYWLSKPGLTHLSTIILTLVVVVTILYSWGGPSLTRRTLECGPYERGGSIYRIGSTEAGIEKCILTVPVSP